MKTILLFFILASFSVQSQSYSVSKITTSTNGDLGPMKGVPGDLFSAMVTFSNSSATPIKVFLNRFKNDLPPYWGLCYCYFECHSIYQDTLTIEIDAFSTNLVVLQFKTDSVNPGLAHASFKVYELGFDNNSQNIDFEASTLNDVGINELNGSSTKVNVYPNPATNQLNISTTGKDLIKEIKIYNSIGQLAFDTEYTNTTEYNLNISDYTQGIYFIEVYSDKTKYVKKFIKN